MYGTFVTSNIMNPPETSAEERGRTEEQPSTSLGQPEEQSQAPPITFEDLGIRSVHATRRTVFGTVQTCQSLQKYEISFLVLSVLSFLLSLGLTIQRLFTLDQTSDDFTFAILLLVTTVFCLYYAIDGILLERLYEILVCVASTFIVMIYCTLNYAYGVKEILKLVRMILSIVLGLCVMGTGSVVALDYARSGDLIFRTIGANMELQRACHILYTVQSLLGFDLQLEASMLIFVMRKGTELGDFEKIILGVGVPFSVLWIIVGCFASRLENKPLSVLFLLMFWVEPAYVIYKFYTLDVIHGEILKNSIIACGTAAIIVRMALLLAFGFAMRNYGKGLKEKIYARFAAN